MKNFLRKWLGINAVEADILFIRKEARELTRDVTDKSETTWLKNDLQDVKGVLVALLEYLKVTTSKEWVEDESFPKPTPKKIEVFVINKKKVGKSENKDESNR